jgi:hypothetical protein
VAVDIVINSRPAQALARAVVHSAVEFIDLLRAGLLPSLFNFIVRVFKQIIHLVEALLFRVDEWLRFRTGESELSMILRAVMTMLWFPISYLARLNMVVLIEPALNPVKLPVCLIAAKFWYPLTVMFLPARADVGVFLWAIVFYLWYWAPDVFGFLFWEIRENWSLYRANRPRTLQPIVMGPHGETLPRLLLPGFHAGTIPKLFARLRHAERAAYRTGNWTAVRSCRASLEHVEESVRLFVNRDFAALLEQDPHWQGRLIQAGKVQLATNRIALEILHARFPDDPLRLEFENRSGHLAAGIASPGWLTHLSEEERRPVHNALATLYKLAGVDVVWEQVKSVLPGPLNLDLTAEGLIVRVDGQPGPAVLYDLRTPETTLAPRLADGMPQEGWPTLQDRQVLFRQIPITWDECVRSWQGEGAANGHLLADDVALLPRIHANGAPPAAVPSTS